MGKNYKEYKVTVGAYNLISNIPFDIDKLIHELNKAKEMGCKEINLCTAEKSLIVIKFNKIMPSDFVEEIK